MLWIYCVKIHKRNLCIFFIRLWFFPAIVSSLLFTLKIFFSRGILNFRGILKRFEVFFLYKKNQVNIPWKNFQIFQKFQKLLIEFLKKIVRTIICWMTSKTSFNSTKKRLFINSTFYLYRVLKFWFLFRVWTCYWLHKFYVFNLLFWLYLFVSIKKNHLRKINHVSILVRKLCRKLKAL